MNQFVKVIFGIFVLFSFLSCSDDKDTSSPEEKIVEKTKPDYIKLEKSEIDSTLSESDKLAHYKAIKASLRALGTNKGDKPSFLDTDSYLLAARYAFKIAKNEMPSTAELIKDGPKLLELSQLYTKAPTEAYNLNEDDYSTVLESATEIAGGSLPFDGWNSSYEHLVLTVINKYANMPDSYVLYEAGKIDASQIEDNEIRFLASLYQAIIFLENGYPQHAEAYSTEAIQFLESTTTLSGTFSESIFITDTTNQKNPIDPRERLEGLSHLVRAIARSNLKDEDERKGAVEDYQAFIEANNSSTSINEWSVLSEAVMMMMNDKPKETDQALNNYLDSEHLRFSERMRLQKITDEEPKNDALNIRHLVMTGIVSEKIISYLGNTDFYSKLEGNEWGDALISFYDRLPSALESVKKFDALKSLF